MATLPQVSTIIVVLSIVVWLCFKHYLLGIVFLGYAIKLFMDFLNESPFAPYTGTVEFEVDLADITGLHYNHRLTEDGYFTLEVRRCKITHFESVAEAEAAKQALVMAAAVAEEQS